MNRLRANEPLGENCSCGGPGILATPRIVPAKKGQTEVRAVRSAVIGWGR